MAMIECSECGKSVSDKAAACVGCGAPIDEPQLAQSAAQSVSQAASTAKGVLTDIARGAADTARSAAKAAGEALKSQEARDAEDIERLGSPGGNPGAPGIDCQKFQAVLEHSLDALFAELMRGKPENHRFLGYTDAQLLTGRVRAIFSNALGVVPKQIEAACQLSEAVLAPSSKERQRLIKAVAGLGGGATGIGMIITGVGGALGWGASAIASVTAFFVGTSMTGPIGWGVAGLAVAGIAAYFATSSNDASDTERFLKVLKAATRRATEAAWPEHGEALANYRQSAAAA